jgi:hypothetical protein
VSEASSIFTNNRERSMNKETEKALEEFGRSRYELLMETFWKALEKLLEGKL